MGAVIKVLIYAAALWVAVELVPGLEFVGESPLAYLAIALVLGVANAVLRPMLRLLSFPLVVVTLGLFALVVNAVILWLVIEISDALDLGLASDGFGSTFLAAVIVSLVTWALETFLGRR